MFNRITDEEILAKIKEHFPYTEEPNVVCLIVGLLNAQLASCERQAAEWAGDTLLTQKEFEKAEKNGEWEDDYNPILKAQDLKTRKASLAKIAQLEAENEALKKQWKETWDAWILETDTLLDEIDRLKGELAKAVILDENRTLPKSSYVNSLVEDMDKIGQKAEYEMDTEKWKTLRHSQDKIAWFLTGFNYYERLANRAGFKKIKQKEAK